MIHNNKIKESFACLIRQNSSTERDLDGDLCRRWSPYFFRINRRDSGSASIIWFNPLQSHWESYFPSLCWTICKQLLADSFRFECVYFMKSGVWGKVCRVDSSGTPSIRFNWPLMFFKSVRRFYWRRTADAASIIAARRASTANTKKQTNKTKHKLWVTLGEVDDADVNYVCSGPSQSLPAGSTQFDPFTPFSLSLSLRGIAENPNLTTVEPQSNWLSWCRIWDKVLHLQDLWILVALHSTILKRDSSCDIPLGLGRCFEDASSELWPGFSAGIR